MKKIVIVYCFLSLNFFAQETKVKCIEEESKQFTDEYGDSYSESKSICEYRNIRVQIIERSDMYDCKFSCYDKKYLMIKNNSAVEKSLKDLFSKNQIIKLIDKADLHMNWFLKSENINRYSKKAQARFKNDYVNSIQFALTTISPLSSREIIDFSYREKNHSYYYLCEKDWQKEFLENASINKDIYPNA